MKKTYISPELHVVQLHQTENLMTLSIKPGTATGTPALIKSEGDWDIWGGDDVDFDEE